MKYHSKKIVAPDGIFDSKREYGRWLALKNMEARGEITNLERQIRYELVPQICWPDSPFITEHTQQRKVNGIYKGKVREKPVTYVADFRYYDKNKGQIIVEDSKGFRTADYIIKKKLMLWRFGIEVLET